MSPSTAHEMFVQLSDPHILTKGRLLMNGVDTADFLMRAIAHIVAMPHTPSHVLITGDLVESGELDQYLHLRELLTPLPCPVLLMPGNHDAVPHLRKAFTDHPYLDCTALDPALSGFALYETRLGSRRLLALDTSVPGEHHGSLCTARLEWLRARLEAVPDTPTIVAMHHPPFATGIRHMDTMGLREGGSELEALIQQHPQVERILCGHLHRPITRRFGGTLAMTAPSPAHQITLGLAPNARPSFIFEPPGLYIHTVQAEHLVTHLQPLGDFGEPQLYR